MSDNEEAFHRYVKLLRRNDQPDSVHRDRLEAQLRTKMRQRTSLAQSRALFGSVSIMKNFLWSNRLVRYSAMATVSLAIVAAVVLLSTSSSRPSQAWAAEATDEAMARFETVYIAGTLNKAFAGFGTAGLPQPDQSQGFKVWARKSASSNGTGDVRMELASGQFVVTASDGSAVFEPTSNTLFTTKAKVLTIQPWLSSAFKTMQAMADQWEVSYGQDEHTKRQSAFVSCCFNDRSWWFEFDLESKLPVRFKQWSNAHHEGEPDLVAESVEYGLPIEETKFELTPPAGAKVQEARMPASAETPRQGGGLTEEKIARLLDDPADGIALGTMTKPQGAQEITRRLIDAMIRDDKAAAGKLWPVVAIMSADNWQEIRGKNPPVEIIEVGPGVQEPDCGMGPVVPCRVMMKDGATVVFRLVVKFREIDGKASCVIAGTFGKPRELPDEEDEQE